MLCLSNSAEPAPQYAGAGLLQWHKGFGYHHFCCQASPQCSESEPRLAATSTALRPLQCQEDMSSCAQVLSCSVQINAASADENFDLLWCWQFPHHSGLRKRQVINLDADGP